MYESNKTGKFESLEELRHELEIMGHEYDLLYNGKEYFLSGCHAGITGKEYIISTAHNTESLFETNSLDDLLDNCKIDSKPAREFLLEADIEYEY